MVVPSASIFFSEQHDMSDDDIIDNDINNDNNNNDNNNSEDYDSDSALHNDKDGDNMIK